MLCEFGLCVNNCRLYCRTFSRTRREVRFLQQREDKTRMKPPTVIWDDTKLWRLERRTIGVCVSVCDRIILDVHCLFGNHCSSAPRHGRSAVAGTFTKAPGGGEEGEAAARSARLMYFTSYFAGLTSNVAGGLD